jgi:ornithine cyclodeaminase/alanine dehydrogenase-like protein (mu-crystallin family)
MDSAEITALRTGAATAVAARYLARADAAAAAVYERAVRAGRGVEIDLGA